VEPYESSGHSNKMLRLTTMNVMDNFFGRQFRRWEKAKTSGST
jgi:glutamine amidotransferase PdxT